MSEKKETKNVWFLLVHKKTGEEIEMRELGINDEYSLLAFSASKSFKNGKYTGIARLPDCDDIRDFDVYVIIDGKKYLWDGDVRRVWW